MVPIVPSRILCLCCCCCLVYSLQLSPCTCWSIAPSTVPTLSLILRTAVSYILLSYVSPGYGISRPLDLRHLGSLDPLHLTSSLRTTCYHPVSPQHSPTPCTRPSLLHSSIALGTYTPYSMYSTCTPTLSTCYTILHTILLAIARTPYYVYLHTMYLHPVLRCMTPIPRSLVSILTATL